MTPAVIVAIITTVGSIVVGIIAYRRGAKGDQALNATNGMQVVVGGLGDLIESLQQELKRQHDATEKCEKDCSKLREDNKRLNEDLESTRIALRGTQSVVEEQTGEIARLKMRINELETL